MTNLEGYFSSFVHKKYLINIKNWTSIVNDVISIRYHIIIYIDIPKIYTYNYTHNQPNLYAETRAGDMVVGKIFGMVTGRVVWNIDGGRELNTSDGTEPAVFANHGHLRTVRLRILVNIPTSR